MFSVGSLKKGTGTFLAVACAAATSKHLRHGRCPWGTLFFDLLKQARPGEWPRKTFNHPTMRLLLGSNLILPLDPLHVPALDYLGENALIEKILDTIFCYFRIAQSDEFLDGFQVLLR